MSNNQLTANSKDDRILMLLKIKDQNRFKPRLGILLGVYKYQNLDNY
jgi:hypothetical protein